MKIKIADGVPGRGADERVINIFSSPVKIIKHHENEATVCSVQDALLRVHSVSIQQLPAGKLDLVDTADKKQ